MPDHLLSIYERALKRRSSVCALVGLCLLIMPGAVWYWIGLWTADRALKPLSVRLESKSSNQVYLTKSERYFVYIRFKPVGPLAGAGEDFLTPRAKAIPCDFKVVLSDSAATLKEEIVTSLKPAYESADQRLGYELVNFDTNESGLYQLSIESLSSFDDYSIAEPTLEVHLSHADWEGRMFIRSVGNFIFLPAMILGLVLMIAGPFLQRDSARKRRIVQSPSGSF